MLESNSKLKELTERKLSNAEKALSKGLDVLYRKKMEEVYAIDAEINWRKEWGIYWQFNF